MSETTAAPEPGIYPDTPFETYHAWPAASASQLERLLKSPAHMKAYREEPPKQTPALMLGTAIHACVLEPEVYEQTYITSEQCVGTTKTGKRCSREGSWPLKGGGFVCTQHLVEEENIDRSAVVLPQGDIDTVEAVARAIFAHTTAGSLIRAATHTELSIVWDDPLTGVRCKARLDAYAPVAGGSIADLKTALDGGLLDFERALIRWGYHRKAWFYLRGAKQVGLEARHFPIIAAEKTAPWAVAVYRISDGVVTYLEDQMTALLELYGWCERRQMWPGYSERVREISVPDWGWRQIDDETDEVRGRLDSLRARESKEVVAA